MLERLTGTLGGGPGGPGGPGGSRVRRLAMPLGALGLVALVIGVLAGAELPATSKGASQPAKSTGAATVQRRDLVATDTQSGTLGYANSQTVYNRLSGTVTWLPSTGQVIKPGGTLYKVDNSPVVLFDGTTPAYRTLSSGVSNGPDVQELNQNLVSLGFDPSRQITINQTWQAATTAAVDRWQAALGETQTGAVTLGQIVFLPGPQLITTVQTVLGSTGGGSGGTSGSGSASSGSGTSSSSTSGSSTGASTVAVAPRPQFISLTSTTSTAATPSSPLGTQPPSGSGKGGSSTAQLKALIALLKAEIAELRFSKTSSSGATPGGSRGAGTSGGSASAGASSAASGGRSSGAGASGAIGGSGGGSTGSTGGGTGSGSSAAAAAQAILQTTSTQEVVTVQLDATKQSEAVVGEPVTVQLPDGSTTTAKITHVSPVAQSSSSSSSSSASGGGGGGGSTSSTPTATIPVTISVTGRTHLSGLDQAAVSVNFAQQRAKSVLSVPVTSLIAVQGGGYTLQEAAAPHDLIPVSVGLFAAGYVQISGSRIYPGLQVTDSQG